MLVLEATIKIHIQRRWMQRERERKRKRMESMTKHGSDALLFQGRALHQTCVRT